MRKQVVGHEVTVPATGSWLDLERLARVEITSEDPGHPIESALVSGEGPGWRAGESGAQKVRLLFDTPQRVRRVRLVFDEEEHPRTQEFALRWRPEGAGPYRPLLLQQFNFSPPGTTREVEDYTFDLDGVSVLELDVVPDISGGDVRASLSSFRVG